MDVELGEGTLAGASMGARKGLILTYKAGYAYKPYSTVYRMGATGCLQPSQMTALMGPPGSGTATLLKILAGRRTAGSVTGDIWAYVQQANTLISCLTVEEMLTYTVEFKLPPTDTYRSKAATVSGLLEQLGLTSCRNVKVGALTASQAKRTSIGVAMIPNPGALFLEEPTSGMDSFSAHEVAALLQRLSHTGLTVAATLHAPSADVLAMFEQLVLMVHGHTVYSGPAGGAVAYFAQGHWSLDNHCLCSVPTIMSLMSWLEDAAHSRKAQQLAEAYNHSQLKQQNDERIASALLTDMGKKLCRASSKTDVLCTVDCSQHSKTSQVAHTQPPQSFSHAQNCPQCSWWRGVWLLLKYKAGRNHKDLGWVLPRTLDKLLYSFIILTLYLQQGNNLSMENVGNVWSSLFLWTILPPLTTVPYIPSIALERGLYLREREEKLYHAGTFFVSKCLEELPLVIITSVAMASFVFYGVDLQGSFLLFWLAYLLNLCIGIAVAFLVAAVIPRLDIACAVLPTYMTTLLMFAGQVATYSSIPSWWSWYSRIDFMRYAYTALMVNHFDGQQSRFPPGQSPIEMWDMEGKNKWVNLSYLLAFLAAFIVMAYLALAYIIPMRRQ